MSDVARVAVAELISSGLFAVGDGYRAKNEELGTSGLPFARASNIRDGFHFRGADRLPIDALHKVGEKVSRPGDVVFTSKGTVGRFAFVREDTEPFVYSPQLCFWRSLDGDAVDPTYLYFWMKSPDFFAQYSRVKGQTDMADYVSLRDQRQMTIALPSIDEQRQIADVLGALDERIHANRRMNDTLHELTRALLPKLISGELRVRDADGMVEQAT